MSRINFAIVVLLILICKQTKAQEKVYIPDANFRALLNSQYPTCMDGSGDSLIIDEAALVTGIFSCSSKNISNVKGIEYFQNITSFNCSENQLINLPNISSLAELLYLNCSSNEITGLPNLSSNTKLNVLECGSNELTVLPDLSNNINLVMLECYYNRLSQLPDLSNNIKLREIRAFNNQLYSIPDLSANTELTCLDVSYNQLTELPDLSSNTALEALMCSSNQLDSLPDLSEHTSLNLLSCRRNHLTSLPDLSSNINLTNLECGSNQLSSLPGISENTTMVWLDCGSNPLTSLPDLANKPSLEYLNCYGNELQYLPDLSANILLKELNCSINLLSSLPDLSANIFLEVLICSYNQLSSLPDLSSNVVLEELHCSNNQLIDLPDFSGNTSLTEVNCSSNYLDFSDALALRILDTISGLTTLSYTSQKPFGMGGTINLCEYDTLILSIASQDSASSYQWFKDNVVISEATDTLLLIQGLTQEDQGIYTCKSYGTALQSPPMNFGPGISEFVSKPFVVNLNEKAEFTGLGEEECMMGEESVSLTGTPPGGVFGGAGITDTLFNAEVAGMGIHEITYAYTDSNGCVSTASFAVTVEICDAIENNFIGGISLYPNPSDGILFLKGLSGPVKVSVIDTEGREVYSDIVMDEEGEINLSGLKNGIYFIIIDHRDFGKIIVE